MTAVLAVAAAFVFAFAGLQMVNLHSQSGTSVAEAWYQAMGWFAFGMAMLCLVLASHSLARTRAE